MPGGSSPWVLGMEREKGHAKQSFWTHMLLQEETIQGVQDDKRIKAVQHLDTKKIMYLNFLSNLTILWL